MSVFEIKYSESLKLIERLVRRTYAGTFSWSYALVGGVPTIYQNFQNSKYKIELKYRSYESEPDLIDVLICEGNNQVLAFELPQSEPLFHKLSRIFSMTEKANSSWGKAIDEINAILGPEENDELDVPF